MFVCDALNVCRKLNHYRSLLQKSPIKRLYQSDYMFVCDALNVCGELNTVCCSVSWCVAPQCVRGVESCVLQCVIVCCSVLQCAAPLMCVGS